MSFPSLLKSIREARGVSQELLGMGLSDNNSFISRIESGKHQTDKMIRELLINRLGYATDGFEEFLQPNEYAVWYERQQILCAIQNDNRTMFLTALNKFDQLITKDNRCGRQFSAVMHIHLKKQNGTCSEEIQHLYKEALLLTLPSSDIEELIRMPMAAQEINLVLEYIYNTTDQVGDCQKKALKLLHYIRDQKYEPIVLSKIFPKAVCYYLRKQINGIKSDKDLKKALALCDEAIECLRTACRSFYAVELLETKIALCEKLLQKNSSDSQLLAQYRHTRELKNTMTDIYTGYDMSDKTTDDGYFYREMEVYPIGEVVRKRRIMMGLTQQQLSEKANIGQSTVYRIEKGEVKVQKHTLELLFRVLGLQPEVMVREVITESYAALHLLVDLKRLYKKRKYKAAEHILNQLEESISVMETVNKQFLERNRAIIDRMIGASDSVSFIDRLEKGLGLSVKPDVVLLERELFLSKGEIQYLYHIMTEMEKSDCDVQAYLTMFEKYFGKMETDGSVGDCINIYEFVMSRVSSIYGNKGLYSVSDQMNHHIIKTCLRHGWLPYIHRSIYGNYWNAMQQHMLNKQDALKMINQCILLSDFCNNINACDFYKKKRLLQI